MPIVEKRMIRYDTGVEKRIATSIFHAKQSKLESTCLFVRALKRKRLELSTSNSRIDIQTHAGNGRT